MPYEPPPELAALSLAEIAALVEARELPPLDQWGPQREGDSLMRIAADGRWFHDANEFGEGEIKRAAMIRAFAALLTRDEQGRHWLVTPHERLKIAVEDAAFIAVDVKQESGSLAFRLNTDELIIAGPEYPICAVGDPETPAIYLGVRHGAQARLNRSTYGQLVEIALAGGALAVQSQGMTFPLVPQ
jgi:uncharacterized protein